jgi:hypothetical protein
MGRFGLADGEKATTSPKLSRVEKRRNGRSGIDGVTLVTVTITASTPSDVFHNLLFHLTPAVLVEVVLV